MKCSNCGSNLPNEARHCPNCGAACFEETSQPTVQAQQIQPQLSWWGKIWSQSRLARKDYWLLAIPIWLLSVITTVTIVIPIFLFILSFVMTSHRLHDTNRSAWNLLWLLLPLIGPVIMFIFELLPGTVGTNKYGDEPQRIF